MDPTLDGSAVFGTACHVVHLPVPIAFQKNAYPGINGVTSLAMGGRGRTFTVNGVLVADSLPDLVAAVAALLNFADGLTHTFTDTLGTSWPNVLLDGDYRPSPEGPKPSNIGWILPYSCTLTGLS